MCKIAFIPGDGVGIDIAAEAEKVLNAVIERSGLDLQIERFDCCAQLYLDTGATITDEQIDELRKNYSAVFLGTFGDPRIPDGAHGRDIFSKLRLNLDLYVNYRPVRLAGKKYSPLKDPIAQGGEFVILRENLEGANSNIGGVFKEGTPDEEVIQQAIFSRRGVLRILKFACELARRRGNKSLTLCNNGDSCPWRSSLWRLALDRVAPDFPDVKGRQISYAQLLRELLRNPKNLDVIVLSSAFYDGISDLCAELQGGRGLAFEAHLHPGKVSAFLPLQDSLIELAGSNVVNPLGAIAAAAFLLEQLGFEQEARWVNIAIKHALDTDNVTADLGGRLGTRQVGDFITDQIRKGSFS
jgi:3-isopropylmalate dehydrogenase